MLNFSKCFSKKKQYSEKIIQSNNIGYTQFFDYNIDLDTELLDEFNLICPNCGTRGRETILKNNLFACKKCGIWWMK